MAVITPRIISLQDIAFGELEFDVIPKKHWLEITLPKDALLRCFSSHVFEKQGSVYNFNEFLD